MQNWIELQHSYRNIQKIAKDTLKLEYIKCDLYHKFHAKFDALNHSKAFNLLLIFAPSFLFTSLTLLVLYPPSPLFFHFLFSPLLFYSPYCILPSSRSCRSSSLPPICPSPLLLPLLPSIAHPFSFPSFVPPIFFYSSLLLRSFRSYAKKSRHGKFAFNITIRNYSKKKAYETVYNRWIYEHKMLRSRQEGMTTTNTWQPKKNWLNILNVFRCAIWNAQNEKFTANVEIILLTLWHTLGMRREETGQECARVRGTEK